VPEILTVAAAALLVVTVKLAVRAPEGTMIELGTWARAVLLLVSATTAPPGGAKPVKVTVPVEDDPRVTLVGLSVRLVREATVTVRVVVLVTPPYTAVMVEEVDVATPLVVIVKVALVAPAATVTLAGTTAAAVLLLDKVTTAPPAGALPVRVTVPVELFPPTTDVGVLVRVESTGGFTTSVAVRLTPSVAVMVTEVPAVTVLVVMVNVADVLPAGTFTLAGTTAAAVLLLCNETAAPPVGAAADSVTVPVEFAPPVTDVGFKVSDDAVTAAGVTVSVAALMAP
jgi:hypothetical protein